jgi:hypothetical protein
VGGRDLAVSDFKSRWQVACIGAVPRTTQEQAGGAEEFDGYRVFVRLPSGKWMRLFPVLEHETLLLDSFPMLVLIFFVGQQLRHGRGHLH